MARLEFLSLRDFVPPAGAKVYRHRAWTAALWLILFGGFSLAMLYVGWRGGVQFNRRGDGIPGFLGWWIGIVWGGCSWLIFGTHLRKRLKPANWLAMLTPDGVFLKYRSYLNGHFPVDDRQIVFLSFTALAGARLHRRRWTTPSSGGRTQTLRASFVELRLADPAEAARLAEALATERGDKGPQLKTWYGSRSLGRHGDHPVQVLDGAVAIAWGAHPDARQFLADIADRVALSDAARTDYDWRATHAPDDEAAAIRALGRMGNAFPVIALLRRKLGLSLTDAKAQSDRIRQER